MGRYHPHGDTSIYGAMVRLSQPWIMRYPLIDWHGNNGNIAGDGPAASRYTEARLSKISEDGLLNGIKKNNVNFISNYDETLEEPVTLPAIFPNLLCNPNTGIGVAMACNWAPHNLTDVSVAITAYLQGLEPTLPGPDFPTGGLIINKNDISKIMETGRGTVKLRARYTIENNKIIFYEIPYGETIEGLIAEVGIACEKNEIEGITDIHDESSKKIRIVITCDKEVEPELIVKRLYQKTNFQTSFSYNQVALVNKTPTELNLKDTIEIYVNHNIECIVKECQFDLTKAQDRLEIVEGLLKALEDIDNIIALIKSSENAAAAKENLISKYSFTDNQAKAILAMRLSSLAKLEKIELQKESAELKDTIDNLTAILNNKNKQKEILQTRLDALVKKYGDARRTEIIQLEETKEEKAKIEITPEDVVVIISQTGDIKRIPKTNFKVQHKGGKGVKTLDDTIMKAISTNTIDDLMIFSSTGKMYKLSVDKIPEGTNASKGTNIRNFFSFENNEKIQTVTSVSTEIAPNVVFFTKKGLIKKTLFSEYSSIKKTTGTQAIKIKDEDSLLSVSFMGEENIIIITKNGYAIKVPTNDIKAIGRLTSGVKGIALKDNDEVVAAFPVSHMTGIITSAGKGKKIPTDQFVIQARGGRGVSCIKLDQGDWVVAAAPITNSESLLIIGKPNSICIPVSEIAEQSKAGSGTKVIENSIVHSIVRL